MDLTETFILNFHTQYTRDWRRCTGKGSRELYRMQRDRSGLISVGGAFSFQALYTPYS